MVDATRKLLDELMGKNRNKENVREQVGKGNRGCKVGKVGKVNKTSQSVVLALEFCQVRSRSRAVKFLVKTMASML